jgi:hypothetical protein
MDALVRRRTSTDEFSDVRNAWVVSALIRGWFHDYMARLTDHQIWHHPVRGGVLPRSSGPPSCVFRMSEAELIYANIIVASALDQNPAERGRWWVDAVSKSRRRWKQLDVARTLSEEPFSAPAEAERRAILAAERLEIGVSRHLDRALEWSMKLAPVALSLALTSWQTLPVDAVTILAGDRATKYASRAFASRATGRQARLGDLARAGPGRLEAAS